MPRTSPQWIQGQAVENDSEPGNEVQYTTLHYNAMQYNAMQCNAMQYNSQNPVFTRPTFAGLDALGPCVIELRVASIPAIIEPGAVASTATAFAGFLGSTALRTVAAAYRGHTSSRGYFCGHVSVYIMQKITIP